MTGFREADHPRIGNGTFTDKEHSAPELVLGDASTAEGVVEVTVPAYWWEKGVLPTPRHKVPRDIARDIDVTVTVPAITSDDAPVGLTTTIRKFHADRDDYAVEEYRVYDGGIYRAVTENIDGATTTVTANDASIRRHVFRSHRDRLLLDGDSEEAATADAQSQVEDYMSIDGELWSKASEPVYYTRTYGMGGASGSTALHIGDVREFEMLDHTTPENVFHAGQREEAIAYARALAESRGDRVDLGTSENIDVADGFEPGSTFRSAPRLTYTSYYDAYYGGGYPADRTALERGLAGLREQLLTVPGAVVDTPDGWGGTTKRVDTTKITALQASDYTQYVEAVEKLNRG